MPHHTIAGADVSTLEEVEDFGGVFKVDGKPADLFDILAANGTNTIRLRLWVDPYDEDGHPYLGGTNDLDTTIRLAQRATERGLDVILNLHYSDFWTDPKKQAKPRAWRDLSGGQLEAQMYSYTADVLTRLKAAGVQPRYVQVGNEITNGMLWPDGELPHYLSEERRFADASDHERSSAYDRLAGLLRAGTEAVRDHAPHSRIIMHLDFAGANDLYRGWFDEMTARKLDYDVIGLSYYPFWHGSLTDLGINLYDIAERYGKDVLVVEYAYAHRPDGVPGQVSIFSEELATIGGYPATVEGQEQFLMDLADVVASVPGGRGLGAVYWEPAWLPVTGTSWASPAGMRYGNDPAEPGNPWANQCLFDSAGNALASLKALRVNHFVGSRQ